MVRFDLTIQLDYDVATPSDFVFNIQPAKTPHQKVVWEALSTLPPDVSFHEDGDRLGNRHVRLHAEPGSLRLIYGAIVDVRHHFDIPSDVPETPVKDLPSSVLPYIYPSRFCQSDRLVGVAWEQFANMEPGYARWCDQTWLIGVDDAIAKQRLIATRKMSEAEVDQRLKSMRPFEERAPGADWSYKNNTTLDDLRSAVNGELDRILTLFRAGTLTESVFGAWWAEFLEKNKERLKAAGVAAPESSPGNTQESAR